MPVLKEAVCNAGVVCLEVAGVEGGMLRGGGV